MRQRSRAGGEGAKSQRHKAVTPKRRSAPESVGTRGSSVAGQETEVARLTRERDEAREQQAATAEILSLISNSPTDTLPVFKTILAKAVELCEASFGAMWLVDGKGYRTAAMPTYRHSPTGQLTGRRAHVRRAGDSHGGLLGKRIMRAVIDPRGRECRLKRTSS